jgi:hypothetical protein
MKICIYLPPTDLAISKYAYIFKRMDDFYNHNFRILPSGEQPYQKLYFIKWVGYSSKENTWEPVEHLSNVVYMVEEFELNRSKLFC